MGRITLRGAVCVAGLWLVGGAPAASQAPGAPPAQPPKIQPPRVYGQTPPPTSPSRVEKLSDSRLRVGAVSVDLARKEVSVKGTVNDVPLLEFLVNTKGGYKSYESAVEAECNAIDFNLGLVLIGLDRDRTISRPRFHFDPVPPQGDPVEIWVSWEAGGQERRVRAEELVYDEAARKALATGNWVYTGSQFITRSRAFMADAEGVLIGFVHTPAPLIERMEPVPGAFGAVKLNPHLGLVPGMTVTVTVRALPLPKK